MKSIRDNTTLTKDKAYKKDNIGRESTDSVHLRNKKLVKEYSSGVRKTHVK